MKTITSRTISKTQQKTIAAIYPSSFSKGDRLRSLQQADRGSLNHIHQLKNLGINDYDHTPQYDTQRNNDHGFNNRSKHFN